MPDDVLDEVLISQDRYQQYRPGLDPSVFAYYSQLGTEFNQSFAPPVPAVLPEVQVVNKRLDRTPAPPKPTSPIVTAITRVLTPVTALFFPQPMGPRVLDEAPAIPTVLPEVQVTAPRLPPKQPPKLPPVAMDPIQPPNWRDLARPDDLTKYEVPIARPTPDFSFPLQQVPRLVDFIDQLWRPRADRPDTQLEPLVSPAPRRSPRNPSPVRVPQPGFQPYPNPWEEPRRIAEPIAPPYVAPETPWTQPLPTEQPRTPDPNPRVRPQPITRPGAQPNPLLNPVFQAFPFSPYQPAPNFRTTPAPVRTPAPRAPPRTAPTDPFRFMDPLRNPSRQPDPLDTPSSQPDKLRDKECKCPKPKKKKEKKREPREQCRQGTYTQRAKGIIYTPKRIIPCQ